ncbi:MAG: hypothetical protein APG12_00300 [Candidatus Methanofastidiosum methylothiophilum]|uniref:Uncharacterized protein n=1 Tax=Candidatus Methanofastidiosum methylothiophilum TaxID=1705564 RepID=A0A150IUD9_9EURY|nr:MAG: hypothetical protein APG10_00334 [Candidatus Methanofastidiosum methylthiophilus]KYC48621.1 MAG: hypothetical protein APG11_00131 [Candidatus Methanofastidiosum methylthiophilus]KYC51174.1 MAG: hypothetical protein APG12_00300 [Candidatus Methanofastidiosum methylthiophilus]
MNNKSQFFIFAAILVIISLLAIQYSLLSYRQVSQSIEDIRYSDIPFISNYIESSFRDTSKNAFEEIYRTGNLNSIHNAFAGIYSAHYAIEEKELNYYLSKLDVGIEVSKSSNITFDDDVLFIGPSVFEVGNFNRKLLVDTRKISDSPKRYLMSSDIGQFEVAPLNKLSDPSSLNPYVIHGDVEIIFKEGNYSSNSRIVYNNRAYTFGEYRITYAGMNNIENRAPFVENNYLNIANDGRNYITILNQSGNQITLDGISRFYEGDVFLLNNYLIKITDIKYIPNGQRDDYIKYTILNIQISLQETERRKQSFDPNESPGLRYGLIDVFAIKENGIRTNEIVTGDTVIISTSIHNDLESAISDKDINGSKRLGSSLKMWEIVNVYLSLDEGIFESEGSRYKVKINTLTKKIEGIYELSGTSEILLDIQRCRRDSVGSLACVSAYPIEEGFEFNLRGEEYVVRSISTTLVSFLKRNTDNLEVIIDIPQNPDSGEFKLGSNTYEIRLVRDGLGNVDPYQIIFETLLGEDVLLEIGDSFVLNNYVLVLESVNFLNKDEKWHVYFKLFDMKSEMKQSPVGKTRLFYGWKDGEYQVVNKWKYGYNDLTDKLIIQSSNPSFSKDTNGTLITDDGLLACFSSINSQNFFEYDLYYPQQGQLVWLSDTRTLFEEINTFNKYIKIRVDENKNGIIDENEGYIYVNGSNKLLEKDIFYCGGVGFQVISIIPYHKDGIGRVLLKRVPYYQYTSILERSGRINIEEFTTYISTYKYNVKRPGDYLLVFTYSFEIDGIKKETSQYYNFKVYQ